MGNQKRPARIMMIEDNQVDIIRTTKALENSRFLNSLDTFEYAERALDSLRSSNADGDGLPDLILLDLNLPGMNGQEFLAAVKADSELRRIPVVALTSSDQDSDIIRSWDLGVAGYIVKPIGMDTLLDVIDTLGHLFFELVVLPTAIPE